MIISNALRLASSVFHCCLLVEFLCVDQMLHGAERVAIELHDSIYPYLGDVSHFL